MNFQVDIIESLEGLHSIKNEWIELAQNVQSENIFFEYWFLMPAFKWLRDNAVYVLAVWVKVGKDRRLVFLAPFVHTLTYRRLPISNIRTWNHDYCFSGTPLLHKDYVKESIHTVSKYFKHEHNAVYVYEDLPLESVPVQATIKSNWLSTSALTYTYQRAFAFKTDKTKSYIDDAVPKKKRKEFGRLLRRLNDLGPIAFEEYTMIPKPDLKRWTEDFLKLEASGWKGKRHTAIAQTESHKQFLVEMLSQAESQNKLHIFRLNLGGDPIAMLIVLKGKNTMSTFKTCFDENYGKYSPGVLLMLHATEALFASYSNIVLDSCAHENHPMIDHLWKEKKPMTTIEVSSGSSIGNSIILLVKLREALRRRHHVQH